jgi:hypothetical protein
VRIDGAAGLQLDTVECADNGCSGEEVSGEFVVPGGDAAPIPDAAEVVLDPLAALADALGIIAFLVELPRPGMMGVGVAPSSLIC